jgi:hypothetical protein
MPQARATAALALAVTLPVATARAEEPAGAGHAHRNDLALFVGATNVDNTQRPTLGIDYERRLTPRFGAGVIADWVFGGEGREFILAPAGFLRPLPTVRVVLAAGLQRNRAEREVEGVVRLGAEYLIEVDERWSVAPGARVDFVAGETVTVLGVAVAYAF